MAKIMFIKPALETDAVWDPRRTCSYLGMWFLASHLREQGHQVRYLDEVVRDGGLDKRELFVRTLAGDHVSERRLDCAYEQFHEQKMKDFHDMTPRKFVDKYSAFRDSTIVRTLVRTGNHESSTLDEIAGSKPDIIGIPLIASANYLPATRLAASIKRAFPQVKVVFGGQHVSADPKGFLESNPIVDHVITGDAIKAIDEIVEGRTYEKVLRGGFITMPHFPLLDPDLLDENSYPAMPTYTYTTEGRRSVDYMFSKGCFRDCSFCVAGNQEGNHVSPIDYKMVDKQLGIFKGHGYQEIIIQDDAFLWDRSHVKEHLPMILGLMKKHGFYWQNNGGVEFEGIDAFVTEQLIDYNKAGEGKVTALYVPFNPRAWNKSSSAARTMSERYHNNLENLKRLREEGGIYVFTSSIIGTPEQTPDSFAEEIATEKALIKAGYIDASLPLCATMIPGTQWHRSNGHNIVDKHDWPGYSLFTTHHRTDNLSPQMIEEYMVRWNKELGAIQKTYPWGNAFANAEHDRHVPMTSLDE